MPLPTFGLWREVTTSVDGDTAEYGCNDIKLISQLFNGVNNGLPAVLIDNYAGFIFGDGILGFRSEDETCIVWIPAPQITGTDKNLHIPNVIAADDTFATLGLAQTFTKHQTIKESIGELLVLYQTDNTTSAYVGIQFETQNSSSAETPMGWIYTGVSAATAGSESSYMDFYIKRSGTSQNIMTLGRWGTLALGHTAANQGSVTRNISRSGGEVNFANTTSEQTMFTATVYGNTMGAAGIVHLKLIGTLLQNQATGTNFTLKIKWGGTTVYQDDIASALGQSATFLPYMIDVYVYNKAVTNAQGIAGTILVNDTGGSAATGIGDSTDDEQLVTAIIAGVEQAKDTTADQTLAVTMTMSVANANVQTNIDYKWCELNSNA